jgi:plasmid stabilization system protein ParE
VRVLDLSGTARVFFWPDRNPRYVTTIGLEQPATAERYFHPIEDKARLLESQLRMGVRRSDIRPFMRMLIQSPYLILYRTDPGTA